jgi:hypothetical protein
VPDVGYWITYPLDSRDMAVLRRVQAGTQRFGTERLIEAYLIARGCVKANLRRRTLAITPKGADACCFYAPRLRAPAG